MALLILQSSEKGTQLLIRMANTIDIQDERLSLGILLALLIPDYNREFFNHGPTWRLVVAIAAEVLHHNHPNFIDLFVVFPAGLWAQR